MMTEAERELLFAIAECHRHGTQANWNLFVSALDAAHTEYELRTREEANRTHKPTAASKDVFTLSRNTLERFLSTLELCKSDAMHDGIGYGPQSECEKAIRKLTTILATAGFKDDANG